eukprot:1056674_1
MAQQVEPFGDHDKSRYTVTGTVVQSLDGSHGCVYGTKWVNSGSHKWVIQYDAVSRCCGAIGIASHSGHLSDWGHKQAVNVCYYHDSSTGQSRVNLTGKNIKTDVTTKLASGDTLCIVLNYDE